MTRAIFIALALIVCTGCDLLDSNRTASVDRINGLYVYALSKPQIQVEVLGEVHLKQRSEESNTLGNIVNELTLSARKEHPKAEAIILDESLNYATVVRHKMPRPELY